MWYHAQAKLNNKPLRLTDKRRAREELLFTNINPDNIADVVAAMPGITGENVQHNRSSHSKRGAGSGAGAPAAAAVLQLAIGEAKGATAALNQYFDDIKSIFRFYRCVNAPVLLFEPVPTTLLPRSTRNEDGSATLTRQGWWKFIKDCHLRGRSSAHTTALELIFDAADKNYDMVAGPGSGDRLTFDNPDSYVTFPGPAWVRGVVTDVPCINLAGSLCPRNLQKHLSDLLPM